MKPATPCSPKCPAVTGEPYGGARYCAMQERARHRSWDPDSGYDHPDYTDCCADFRCCADKWAAAGLAGVAAALVEGAPVVHVGDPSPLPITPTD